MSEPVPAEIVLAAWAEAPEPRHLCYGGIETVTISRRDLESMLRVAVPLIREAEVRNLVLVWRDERGEEIARCPRLHPGTERIAIPLDAQHCDLEATDA